MGRTTQATTTAVGIAAALASFVVVGSSDWYGPTASALAPRPVTAPPLAASSPDTPPGSPATERTAPLTRILALPPVPTDPPSTAVAVAVAAPQTAPPAAGEIPAAPPPAAPADPDPAPPASAPHPVPATDPAPEPEPEPAPGRTPAAAEPETHPSDRAATAPGRVKAAYGRTNNARASAADERGAQARLPLTDSARHTARSHGPTHQRPAHPDRHRPGP